MMESAMVDMRAGTTRRAPPPNIINPSTIQRFDGPAVRGWVEGFKFGHWDRFGFILIPDSGYP